MASDQVPRQFRIEQSVFRMGWRKDIQSITDNLSKGTG